MDYRKELIASDFQGQISMDPTDYLIKISFHTVKMPLQTYMAVCPILRVMAITAIQVSLG